MIEIGSKTAEKNSAQTNKQTDRQTDTTKNGHLDVNQKMFLFSAETESQSGKTSSGDVEEKQFQPEVETVSIAEKWSVRPRAGLFQFFNYFFIIVTYYVVWSGKIH